MRAVLFAIALLVAPLAHAQDWPGLRAEAGALSPLRALVVAQDGVITFRHVAAGPATDRPVNVKSISKTFMAALAGAALHAGLIDGPEQTILPLLRADAPADPDPQLATVTFDHLLSMRSGLERTSGQNYGRWVTNGNWVRYALARPFVAPPGTEMRYSTGNSHLLSAALTAAAGRDTHALMRDLIAEPLGVSIPRWQRDPQGVYFGGNNMAIAPETMIALGELYRRDGLAPDGTRVLAEGWVDASWTKRARSRWTGHDYGYGWFMLDLADGPAYYGWGYGGQMLYVLPALNATIAITSNADAPSGRTGYAARLHRFVAGPVSDHLRAADS